ncbi:NAD-dependent epimerase/dehydratase family protein [Jannaschia rubra]|uniref:NAD-dependent epimerase/dehydratase family protein n=1 Tax=Jannaschia rubra TaxID=282197 RepID=UPI0024917EC2|nr:NAD-dependent epimerase/dehydratase family protein [Jannaschia rubra]
MKTLVIGGCGFIGSHVVDSLVAAGGEVRVLSRRPEAFRAPVDGVNYVIGDMAEADVLARSLSGMDAVVHLASTTVPATSNLDPEGDIAGNLIGTVRLLQVMREAGVRRMVYLSSGGTVYGVPETDPVGEDHPLRPVTSYGIVKVAIEKYLHMDHRLHGLDYAVLRAANPYGPRQGRTGVQGIIGTLLWRLSRNAPIEVWGDGSVVRDYLHVRDMAALCVAALKGPTTGVFNAGSGRGTSVAEILDIVARVTGRRLDPVRQPGRDFDVPRIVLDSGKARRTFGWQPEIALEDGIAETWDWVREQTALT